MAAPYRGAGGWKSFEDQGTSGVRTVGTGGSGVRGGTVGSQVGSGPGSLGPGMVGVGDGVVGVGDGVPGGVVGGGVVGGGVVGGGVVGGGVVGGGVVGGGVVGGGVVGGGVVGGGVVGGGVPGGVVGGGVPGGVVGGGVCGGRGVWDGVPVGDAVGGGVWVTVGVGRAVCGGAGGAVSGPVVPGLSVTGCDVWGGASEVVSPGTGTEGSCVVAGTAGAPAARSVSEPDAEAGEAALSGPAVDPPVPDRATRGTTGVEVGSRGTRAAVPRAVRSAASVAPAWVEVPVPWPDASRGAGPKRYQPAPVAATPTATTLDTTEAITNVGRGRRCRPAGRHRSARSASSPSSLFS
ncbi:hypothetical protein [Actinopolymorpha pittospori]|uniref:Uncharacterized protein n=1 Tax=Actinopolymorpha pittospori TaxID=648752 RepID=A0A927RD44_9ACTN|nr:hypothetical protein [Actinopolymorpha pittospori]MBE1611957.1 hypothetical protein [Actinopolymorpha pittospori]